MDKVWNVQDFSADYARCPGDSCPPRLKLKCCRYLAGQVEKEKAYKLVWTEPAVKGNHCPLFWPV